MASAAGKLQKGWKRKSCGPTDVAVWAEVAEDGLSLQGQAPTVANGSAPDAVSNVAYIVLPQHSHPSFATCLSAVLTVFRPL